MAYAVAGLATASGGAISAQAAIHYSGRVDYTFHGRAISTAQWHSFPLSNGARLWGGTIHIRTVVRYDYAYFGVTGAKVSNSLRVASETCCAVAGLPGKSVVSDGSFFVPGQRGVMQGSFCQYPDWHQRGTYYVGFRFNTGAGPQYGWVRIRWDSCPANYFMVKDYAWGDPGDRIKTGQRQLHEDETKVEPQTARRADAAPLTGSEGSLGLLALGAVGLVAWRRNRGLAKS